MGLEHSISLAVGARFPSAYDSRDWNAHVKDELDHLLPQLVCQGRLDLVTAQHDIAANWILAYQKYFQTDRPIARQSFILVDDDDIEVARSNANPQAVPTSPSELRPFRVVSIVTGSSRGWGVPARCRFGLRLEWERTRETTS